MDLKYLEDKFSSDQIEEIRLGLLADLDVSNYARPEYNAQTMFMMKNNQIMLRETNENQLKEIENLAKCKDINYYKELAEFYKDLYQITIDILTHRNTMIGNRNRIVERYLDKIPTEAFKSLCDAENLYYMLKIKRMEVVNKYLLEEIVNAYILVLAQMFVSILKDNYNCTIVNLESIRETIEMVIRKSEKNEFTDFYKNFENEFEKASNIRGKIITNEICEEDIETLRKILFEFYPIDGGYKCNLDILAEIVEKNPLGNVNLIDDSIDEGIMDLIGFDF